MQELIKLLRKYHECFAWIIIDKQGIDIEIVCHWLAINHNVRPVQQKKRHHNHE